MSDDKDDCIFLVEVDSGAGDVSLEMSGKDVVRATKQTLQRVVDVVRDSCQTFIDDIEKLPKKPSSIELEFGIDIGGEAGIPLVTKGSVSANFKVTLMWDWK